VRSATFLRRAGADEMRASALLGARLRALREQKGLSQGDMERRTGLLRCYVSNVEHSHTVPSIDTLERIARALDVSLCRLFCEGSETGDGRTHRLTGMANRAGRRASEKDPRFLRLLLRHIYNLDEQDRGLLLFMARKMARAGKKERRG
jgi:transcriptional regulator with XRE-family HTH domain